MVDRRPYADAAEVYWRAGWPNPIPVHGRDGRALGKNLPPSGFTGYEGANVSWPDLQAWLDGPEAGHNIALRLPQDVVGIDVDAYDGKVGDVSLAAAEAELGPLPESWRSTSRPPFQASGIRFYRVGPSVDLRGAEKRFTARFGDHVDVIRRDHRYAVVWPSIHPDTGAMYLWYDPTGERYDPPAPAELPELPAAWQEFLTAPARADPAPAADEGAASIRESPWDLPREFTRAQAVDFVRPAFERLRSAPDGTINNRLNEAAVTIGHFVPAFWSWAEAQAYLLDALADTVYDGKTWRAEATIASGLKARTWRAVLVDEPPATDARDERDGAIAREVARLHFHADVREQFDAERHARSWAAPADHGHLGAELALPDEGVQWRLKGLLAAGHNAILVAGRKVGKTTTVNNLVRSYVDHEAFLSRFDVVAADAAVAVFNYEVDERQYRRWLRDAGIVNVDRVFVLHLRGRSLPLRDARVRAWTAAWLRARGVGLWIVDPYSRAYVGSLDDGNDEAKVGAFLDTLDVIKAEAGVGELVMPVHTPKAKVETGEESAIGSQRLEGWPDSMWYLTRDFDSGLRFLRAEGRDVDVAEEQLTYHVESRSLVLGGWDKATARRKADLHTAVAFIRENMGCTQNEIQAGLAWSARRTKDVLEWSGNAIRKVPGKNRSVHHYVD